MRQDISPGAPHDRPGPPGQSPWQRTRLGLSRWWNGGIWQKVALISVVPFLCICTVCSSLLVFAATPYGQQLVRDSEATSTAQTLADAQAAATATQYAIDHPAPTAMPTRTPARSATPAPTKTATPAPTATLAPGGPPYVGGPYADFIATYGQPFSQGGGGTENFYADNTQDIILNVGQANGAVTAVTVLGPTSWTNQQTFDYCTQFLPSDATEFNSTGQYTDYNSSVGEVILWNLGQGTCKVFLPQS